MCPDLGDGQHTVPSHSFSLLLSTSCVSLSLIFRKQKQRRSENDLQQPPCFPSCKAVSKEKLKELRLRAELPIVVRLPGTCSKCQAPHRGWGDGENCNHATSVFPSLTPLPLTPSSTPSQDNFLDVFPPNFF